MRTLSEIIDAAKDGEPTTHDECLYALLAYSSLHHFASAGMRRLIEYPNSRLITPQSEAEEEIRRFKTALGKSPKDWVGWNNDPKNPAYQRFRRVGKKLVDKLANAPQERP